MGHTKARPLHDRSRLGREAQLIVVTKSDPLNVREIYALRDAGQTLVLQIDLQGKQINAHHMTRVFVRQADPHRREPRSPTASLASGRLRVSRETRARRDRARGGVAPRHHVNISSPRSRLLHDHRGDDGDSESGKGAAPIVIPAAPTGSRRRRRGSSAAWYVAHDVRSPRGGDPREQARRRGNTRRRRAGCRA